MWTSMFQGTSTTALEQTLQFTEKRHGLLASNIANADTPGYQARDLSVKNFQASLGEAISSSRMAPSERDGNQDISRVTRDQAVAGVRDSMKQILYHDGSRVELETQVTEITKNQAMHSMAVSILRSQYRMLQVAISESVNV